MTMNHRVTLLKRGAGKDAAGQPVDDWVELATVWADVLFQNGAQVLRAGADVSVVSVSIRIRARTDIVGEVRARYLGIDYDVKSPLPDSKDRQFMFLVCANAK